LKLNKHNRDDITNDVLLTVFAILGKLEKLLIKKRTKEALANLKPFSFLLAKAKGTEPFRNLFITINFKSLKNAQPSR